MYFCYIFNLKRVLLLLALFSHVIVSAQPSPNQNASLLESLTITFAPPNPIEKSLFTSQILAMDSVLIVRFVLIYSIARYEIAAACHPTALSFFATKDKIKEDFCEPLPKKVIESYLLYRMNLKEFATQAASYGLFIANLGLTPFSKSTDTNTEIGWANVVGARTARYLATDGVNSIGDLSRKNFRRPYFDYTGYFPKNLPFVRPDRLRKPLRWQPLTVPGFSPGSYRSQIHVVPQMAHAKTLALTRDEVLSRRAAGPYDNPNSRKSIDRKDLRAVKGYINEYFKVSRELTVLQRFYAQWWDNKFFSVGSFLTYYKFVLNIDDFTERYLALTEMIAQHDALVVAWKEKLRNDLVRPVTIIRRLLAGKKVTAFVSEELGVRRVDADEYEPLVQTQPHSEFPSASAVLCEASLEYLKVALEDIFGTETPLPRLVFPVQPGTFRTILIKENVTINLSLDDAAESCGMSRLYAGVHFRPSVEAGLKLGEGIGRKAYNQVADLVAGKVPSDCSRCMRE